MTTCRHFGDPCVKCGIAHDDVQPGPCPGRPTPWGDAWRLGRTHAMCGMSRLNPEFFKHPLDRTAYVAGYDGRGNQQPRTTGGTMSNDATDLRGNPYLTVTEAHAGQRVKLDGDFTCASNHARKRLRADAVNGLWFPCREGRHYLDGQLSNDGSAYVGVFPLKATNNVQ